MGTQEHESIITEGAEGPGGSADEVIYEEPDLEDFDGTRADLTCDTCSAALRWDPRKDALARAGRSVDVTGFLARLAADLEGIDRADMLAICALRGRLVEGGELRDAYALCVLTRFITPSPSLSVVTPSSSATAKWTMRRS